MKVEEIVNYIKAGGGDRRSVCDSARTYTKNELEDTSSDLLMISVAHGLPALTAVLLKQGLRSGHALDAAVILCDLTAVNQLLDGGCTPAMSSEKLAVLAHEPAIAKAIAEKRVTNAWFNFRPEF